MDNNGIIGTANFGPSANDSPSWLIRVFLILYRLVYSVIGIWN